MEPGAASVWAVVVAYDAPDTLADCLAALARQSHPVDRVIVVDNGSVRSAQGGPDVEVIRPPGNTGPAGGFAIGLQCFLDGPAAHAWVMDDDIVPAPDALAHQLAVLQGRPPGIAFPLVARADADPVLSLPAWAGVLLPRPVVEAVGLPDERYFYWAEDAEYLHWRIPRAGFAHYDAHRAVVDDRRVRRQLHIPPWGFYYRARNTVYLRLRVQRGRHAVRLVNQLARLTARAAREPGRGAKLGMVVRGVGDGLLGRLGPRGQPVTGMETPMPPGVRAP